MMEEKVLEKKPIPLVEVKELLKERAKEGDLTYEQELTLKYAEKFSKLPKSKAEKLMQELKKIEGLPEEFKIKIVDILPEEKEVLELLAPKDFKLTEELTEKLLDLLQKFQPKKKETTKKKK
jgi:DNA-directed RNA polymerase subunit F